MTSCWLSWTMQPFQNRVYFLRKELAHRGTNSFLNPSALRVTECSRVKELIPNEIGGKNENKSCLF